MMTVSSCFHSYWCSHHRKVLLWRFISPTLLHRCFLGTYRPKDNPGLCFTEEGLGSQNDPIRLRACETDDIRQKWVNDKAFNSKPDRDKNKPFQIIRNTNYCLTQQQHPKAHETVFPQKCSRAENHDTSKWIVYWSPPSSRYQLKRFLWIKTPSSNKDDFSISRF